MGLVLKRYVHEGIRLYDTDGFYIGHIVVEGIDRQRVKLYFDVDSRFHIIRDELLLKDEQQPRKDPAPDSPASRGSPLSASALPSRANSATGSPEIKRRRTA